MRARWILSTAFLGLLSLHASAQDGPGLRAGIGTDISGGIAYGVTVSYTRVLPVHAWEFGLSYFGGSFEEDTDEDINSYHEETDISVVAVMANYMFNYAKGAKSTYMMLGAGAGGFSVEWTESSETDPSLGTPFGSNGSSQTEDGTSGGMIINLGVGRRFTEKFDMRIEAPIFFIFSAPGEATSVAPTLTLTAGYRF